MISLIIYYIFNYMCLPLNTLKSLVSYTAMLTMGLGIFAILSGVIIDTNTK